MAFVEDVLGGNVVVAVALGAAALVAPRFLPNLSPPLRSTVKSGLRLFAEAEAQAEGGIMSKLAAEAVKDMLASLSGTGSEDERREKVAARVSRFEHTARRRARRYGTSDHDRSVRYRAHLRRLKRAMDQAMQGQDEESRKILSDALGSPSETL